MPSSPRAIASSSAVIVASRKGCSCCAVDGELTARATTQVVAIEAVTSVPPKIALFHVRALMSAPLGCSGRKRKNFVADLTAVSLGASRRGDASHGEDSSKANPAVRCDTDRKLVQ